MKVSLYKLQSGTPTLHLAMMEVRRGGGDNNCEDPRNLHRNVVKTASLIEN